jgi:MFS family permease
MKTVFSGALAGFQIPAGFLAERFSAALMLALGTALFMINTHAIAHFVAVGYDKLAAAFYFGFIGFIRIGATILWGSVSDRLGRSKAYGVAVLVTALGVACMIAMTFSAPLWLVYLTIVLYGVGHSAGNPTYGAVIGDIFSGRKIGLIFGYLEISFGLGSALGAWLGGYLRPDRILRALSVCLLLIFPVWRSTASNAETPTDKGDLTVLRLGLDQLPV